MYTFTHSVFSKEGVDIPFCTRLCFACVKSIISKQDVVHFFCTLPHLFQLKDFGSCSHRCLIFYLENWSVDSSVSLKPSSALEAKTGSSDKYCPIFWSFDRRITRKLSLGLPCESEQKFWSSRFFSSLSLGYRSLPVWGVLNFWWSKKCLL